MKATIQKVELFEIEIFGVVHKNFEKVETWKNLACYKNKDGEIVASDYGETAPFDWVFRHLDNSPSKPQEIIVISATPFFINTANSNAK